MSKKKKQSSAQILIDSLLDDQGSESFSEGAAEQDDATAAVAAENTVRLARQAPPLPNPKLGVGPVMAKRPAVDQKTATDIRFGIGQMGRNKVSASPGGVFTSAEASLKQSENLRIAQVRINELEAELERIRRENERLASAGETLRRRADELLARVEGAENKSREQRRIFDEEKKVLRGQIVAKERENNEQRTKIEETEHRLEANFKKIRVRERELEHRLEIVKLENATLVSSKDESIMRLKREIDQLKFESENGKVRSQELYNQFKEKQETIGRVVRALRIALTILEGDEETPSTKKAE